MRRFAFVSGLILGGSVTAWLLGSAFCYLFTGKLPSIQVDQNQRPRLSLGQILVDSGLVKAPELRKALAEQIEETDQVLLVGMGELHLEVLVDRLRREYGVDAKLGRPQVVSRVTVHGDGAGEATYVRELPDKHIHGGAACEIRPRARGAGEQGLLGSGPAGLAWQLLSDEGEMPERALNEALGA